MVDLDLIKKHKLEPPFFIYDESQIKKQFNFLKKSVPSNFKIFYSVKANPNPHILKIFKNLYAGVEISSGGELKTVLKVGFLPKKIIFTSPGKTDEDLRAAVKAGIHLIVVESENELLRLGKISDEQDKKQSILLRINLQKTKSPAMFQMSGVRQKFGIDEGKIKHVTKRAIKTRSVNLMGFHLYAGSNIFDEKIILRNTECLFKLTDKFSKKFQIDFKIVDIGGGVPVNYSSRLNNLSNIKKLSKNIKALVKKYKFENKQIVLESGRFLIAEAGEYVTEIVDKKDSFGDCFVVINGGINHLCGAGLSREGHVVVILGKNKTGKKEIINIVGNLNTPTDFITKTRLQKSKIGDLINIKKTGAYGFTAASVLFSSHDPAKEYLMTKNGDVELISKNR